MTTNSKLTQVLEYLIKNDETKARELLHRVFIEKARAIHEEVMGMDEQLHSEFGSGDQGEDLKNEIRAMEDEIDFEQTMGEGGEEDDMGGDADGMDSMDSMDGMDDTGGDTGDMDPDMDPDMGGEMGGEPVQVSIAPELMHNLEDALEALKAEFAKAEGGDMDPDMGGEMDPDMEPTGDEGGEDMGSEVGSEVDEPVDETENWELDEDFDDLAESLDLDVIEQNMEKTMKTAEEVGSGKSGMSLGRDAKSPVPSSQTERLGAKPVVTGKGKGHTGFNLESAPSSAKLPILPKDNRRKKFEDDMSKVSKEGDGAALLNKEIPTSGKDSPLSKGGANLKSL